MVSADLAVVVLAVAGQEETGNLRITNKNEFTNLCKNSNEKSYDGYKVFLYSEL